MCCQDPLSQDQEKETGKVMENKPCLTQTFSLLVHLLLGTSPEFSLCRLPLSHPPFFSQLDLRRSSSHTSSQQSMHVCLPSLPATLRVRNMRGWPCLHHLVDQRDWPTRLPQAMFLKGCLAIARPGPGGQRKYGKELFSIWKPKQNKTKHKIRL